MRCFRQIGDIVSTQHYSTNDIRILYESDEYGELTPKAYEEVKSLKRAPKKGWQMAYIGTLEEVIFALKGDLEKKIFFYVIRHARSDYPDFPLNQKALAKEFGTTQPYISRVINKLIKLKVLIKTRTKPSALYRLNPYIAIPQYGNALKLQDEWSLLADAPDIIKDKTQYMLYLQSPEWKEFSAKIKEDRNHQCEVCGSRNNLEAHHLTYENLYHENPEDIQILCHQCHERIHMTEKRY